MDWNLFLFASKWIFLGLFYFVLFLLLIGVYGEMSQRMSRQKASGAVSFGKLKVVHPGKDPHARLGKVYGLNLETRLGGEMDNDIVLGDPFVSGYHACLRWDGASWWVEDLGSSNGTKINQKPVFPRHPQPLRPGARLEIGDMAFELLD